MREWMNTPLLLGKDTVVAKIKRFEYVFSNLLFGFLSEALGFSWHISQAYLYCLWMHSYFLILS